MITDFDEITQQTLLELEKTQKQFWNISRVTGEFLNLLIRTAKSKNIIEVGTSNGYSGIWITKALKEIGDTFGIPVLDHIIVSDNNYYSFYEESNIFIS